MRTLTALISGFAWAVDGLCRIGSWLGGVALVAILALVCVEVAARSLFGTSTLIADEMGGYLNAALLYFGMPWALRTGSFIRVEFLYGKLRGPMRQVADWFIVLVSLLYTALVGYTIWGYVLRNYAMDIRSWQFSRTPLYLPQSTMLFGFLVLGLLLVRYALQRVRNIP